MTNVMRPDATGADVVVVETVEVYAVPPEPAAHRVRQRPAPGIGASAAFPAALAIACGAAGYALARFLSGRRGRRTPPVLSRRLAVAREPAPVMAWPSGDSPKRHGDKLGSALRGYGENRAPTYPEG